jgi:hypothetical protein
MAVVSGAPGALLDSLLRGTHLRSAEDLEIINSILGEGRARAAPRLGEGRARAAPRLGEGRARAAPRA